MNSYLVFIVSITDLFRLLLLLLLNTSKEILFTNFYFEVCNDVSTHKYSKSIIGKLYITDTVTLP